MTVKTFSQGANQYSLGHLLITGYSSKNIIASWYSGIVLAHLFTDYQESKNAMVKVVLAANQSQTSAQTLMKLSINLLKNSSSSFHTRVAVLIFPCTWLSNCSPAIESTTFD